MLPLVVAAVGVLPLLAAVGVLPLLAARSPAAGQDAATATVTVPPFAVIVAALVGVWVRYRNRAAAWWRASLEEATAARQPGGFKGFNGALSRGGQAARLIRQVQSTPTSPGAGMSSGASPTKRYPRRVGTRPEATLALSW